MELVPRDVDETWQPLRETWIRLPRHGNLLNAISSSGELATLRYATINWRKPVLILDDKLAHAHAAGIGAQLARVFDLVLENVRDSSRALFLQPFAQIDLDDEVRVGFECGASMRPPDVKLDERAFVFVVGRLWSSLLDGVPTDSIGKIIRRCIEPSRRARFATLEKLCHACLDHTGGRGLRSDDQLDAWYLLEEGLGWRAAGNLDRARTSLQACSRFPHYRSLARWCLDDVDEPHEIDIEYPPVELEPPEPPAPPQPVSPARAAYLEGREHFVHRRFHEARRCFASAIQLDPLMLEAQLLRREVDRALVQVHVTTGTSNAMPIGIPPALRDVRELVVAGRIHDAIAALSTDAYAANVDAPLFRARLLALDGQYALAASAYAAIDDGPHVDEARLGLARVTIDRGKPEAALGLLDALLVTRPRDLGALEARARCLDLLGRTEEASEAMKAFVAAVELASDARLSRAR